MSHAAEGALRAPPLRGRRERRLALPQRVQLPLLAAVVLALAVTGPLALDPTRGAIEGLATRGLGSGTAALQASTCSDWRGWTVRQRMAALQTLNVAATQPDPESAGATLDDATAYGLFQRACSTRVTRSFVLYEVYNRAASFHATTTAPSPVSGGFGTGPHN